MKTIGVFCGGFSSEFDISMKSATNILNALPAEFDSFLIVVKRNDWRVQYHGGEYAFDLNTLSFSANGTKVKLDVGLVYIHGNPGENGKIQAFLEMKGLPCINSSALASELSFDKWFCNQFIKGFGVPVAESILLLSGEYVSSEVVLDKLGLPVFVKPADSGSSYGITKVKSKDEVQPAIARAFEEGETVVIESFLNGREVTCAVYRTKSGVVTLPITEIVSEGEFFDFDAKYMGKSQEITPARITEEEARKISDLTIRIYQLLRLKSVARVDFMLCEGEPFVIEVNTTPGFSAASLVPQMLAVKGLSQKDFWQEILAVELPQ